MSFRLLLDYGTLLTGVRIPSIVYYIYIYISYYIHVLGVYINIFGPHTLFRFSPNKIIVSKVNKLL